MPKANKVNLKIDDKTYQFVIRLNRTNEEYGMKTLTYVTFNQVRVFKEGERRTVCWGIDKNVASIYGRDVDGKRVHDVKVHRDPNHPEDGIDLGRFKSRTKAIDALVAFVGPQIIHSRKIKTYVRSDSGISHQVDYYITRSTNQTELSELRGIVHEGTSDHEEWPTVASNDIAFLRTVRHSIKRTSDDFGIDMDFANAYKAAHDCMGPNPYKSIPWMKMILSTCKLLGSDFNDYGPHKGKSITYETYKKLQLAAASNPMAFLNAFRFMFLKVVRMSWEKIQKDYPEIDWDARHDLIETLDLAHNYLVESSLDKDFPDREDLFEKLRGLHKEMTSIMYHKNFIKTCTPQDNPAISVIVGERYSSNTGTSDAIMKNRAEYEFSDYYRDLGRDHRRTAQMVVDSGNLWHMMAKLLDVYPSDMNLIELNDEQKEYMTNCLLKIADMSESCGKRMGMALYEEAI